MRPACVSSTTSADSLDRLEPADVVIVPAFGVTVEALQRLQRRGCTLVDTTCGSVLNVWKNVRKYARDGYTAVIHGKAHHEETQATASQAADVNAGGYLIVLDRPQAEIVCGRNPRHDRPRAVPGDVRGCLLAGIRFRTATSSAWASPIRRRC